MDLVEVFNAASAVGGLGGVLALVVFFYARRDALQHKKEWRAVTDRYEGHAVALTGIVEGNTAALTTLTETSRENIAATRELRAEVTELRKANGRG